MQFSSALAVLSLALVASANPINVERTGSPTPGQQVQNQCGATATAKCCNSVVQKLIAGVPVSVGLNCANLDLVSVLPLASQCSSTQVVTCCSNSGTQNGLINVGQACVPVTL